MPQVVEMEASQADRLNKHSIQLKQLEKVMDLQRLNKQNALNRRLVRKQQNGSVGQETAEAEDEEDDYIHFGDTVTNVFRGGSEQSQSAPATPAAPTALVPPQEPTVVQQASQALWPIVLASVLGAGGLGVGLTSMLTKSAPVIVPATSTDTDTDTLYQLEFSEPAELIKGAK